MVEKIESIVVGAGPAGSATAYSLARAGREVLLVERANVPGEKNVSGGILYGKVLHDLIPNFWEEAPVERYIIKHKIAFLNSDSSFALDFSSKKLMKPQYNGFSIIRYQFDQWLAKRAEEAGAILATGVRADELLWAGKKVVGIRAGNDEIYANVVVAADGINSTLTEQANLRSKHPPEHVGLGIKEVIQLPPDIIEERFNLTNDEGAAHTYIGCTKGYPGGGFLYTNRESLSLGVMLQLPTFNNGTKIHAPEYINHLKQFPDIQRLIKDGELLEYSAHLVPEGGYRGLSKFYTDGFLVTGDAAGFALNIGYALEGMNFAIASGVAAAKTIMKAADENNYSKKALNYYERLLKQNFVLQDMKTFRNASSFISNSRLQSAYPPLINKIALDLFRSTGSPRPKMIRVFLKNLRKHIPLPYLLLDGIQAVRGL